MSALAIISTVAASIGAIAGLLTLQGFWIKQSLDGLSQRITDQGDSLSQRITDLDTHLSARLDRIEGRVGALERERT
jgi:hypothetical protein